MSRLSAVLSVLLSIAVSTHAQIPRKSVIFFRFAGAEDAPEKRALQVFRAFASSSLRTIPGEPLELQEWDVAAPSDADRLSYQQKSAALALVHGSVFGVSPAYQFANEVFLGDRKGPLAAPTITINVPFSIETIPSGRDALFATALYALAMDEKARNIERAHILEHLAQARGLIDDAMRRPPIAGNDLSALRKAVQDAIDALSAGR